MQSCLEKRGIEQRHVELARQDYSSNNPYSATHPDARATGDSRGKGTGHGGHSYWLPDCNGQMGVFNYSNFDTDPSSGAGNNIDNETRDEALKRSMYNDKRYYSARLVDTTRNRREGQYYLK